MAYSVAGAPNGIKVRQSDEKTRKSGGQAPEFSAADELKAYRDMLLIRRFEEKAGQLYGMGFIGGFCHLYIGRKLSSSACRWR